MHHIAVCDDDKKALNETVELLKAYLAQHEDIPAQIHSFSDGYDLLEHADTIKFDLYILDVMMPVVNGMNLGRKLREAEQNGLILYLTSSDEYALEAYDAQPFHYLIKSADASRLYGVLDKAFAYLRKWVDRSIFVKNKDGTVQLYFDEIVYAEYVNRLCSYHLRDGRVVTMNRQRKSFSELNAPLLEDDRFSRCGASLVINLYYVKAIQKDVLYFKDDETPLFLPKKAGTPLLSAWVDYWMKGERRP